MSEAEPDPRGYVFADDPALRVAAREAAYGPLVLDGRVGERAAVGTELRTRRDGSAVVSALLIEPHRPGGRPLVQAVEGVDLSAI